MKFYVAVKTTNPNNSSQGITRGAMFARAKKRKEQRKLLAEVTRAQIPIPAVCLPVKVTVTRIAPSRGLDPHDGLGAALKGVIDGITDGLDLKDDRDPRVTWELKQRRGKPREYAVEVEVRGC